MQISLEMLHIKCVWKGGHFDARRQSVKPTRTAAMWAYVNELLSGTAAPFWPHFALISGSILAGIAVGAGIIFESNEYPASVHRLAKWLVIVGVAVESLCTVCLFVFDERISDAQQSKIIALETRIAPRFISVDMRNRIADKMKRFAGQEYIGLVASDVGDAWDLWREISLILELAGWKRLPPLGVAVSQYGPAAGIALAPMEGIMVWFTAPHWTDVKPAADALAKALTDEGVLAGSGPTLGDTGTLTIIIGPKPQK